MMLTRVALGKLNIHDANEHTNLLGRNIVSSCPQINPGVSIDAGQNEKYPCNKSNVNKTTFYINGIVFFSHFIERVHVVLLAFDPTHYFIILALVELCHENIFIKSIFFYPKQRNPPE